ncbi:hypothetical protein GUITHDRAFT_149478 [Guillardia theta CCMP2712]|uniref:Heterokaryon incompatibility domain-containing protein n=1 Tax=Guillardia theta (strain CCMP2712) TaxID=905079 RepID=L1I4F1_GUITC|nr:hypothetical protein GUITHDRAFT_149478 [Guillardia theta CCMP2712]EKX31153.1 hypothetical protein GUITHDRAFT_149478 [Guillardia theta CCMP2712]|eukprot:XP_005818133.1 hypothetical protein GUITHDRAFT_149478 [Guillardia theta CCMP2712]
MSFSDFIVDFLNIVTLGRSKFILIARAIACFKLVSLAYFLVWSYGSHQCFRDLTGFASLVVFLPFFACLALFAVEVLFWMFSLYKKMLTRMYTQSLLDANRNLLSLCTPELCMAQKLRIRGLNVLTDVGILIWLIIVCAMYAEFERSQATTQCIYDAKLGEPNSCVICSLQPLVAAYACFLGVSTGIILKTVVLASHGDFTLQSRVLENVLMNASRCKNPFWVWVNCSELRQLYSATMAGILFIPALLLILGGYVMVSSKAQVFIAPLLLAATVIIVLVDGGLLCLPWRLFWSFLSSGGSLPSLKITSMVSRPQRKVIASFLWFLSVPWIGGCLLANMGALGGINNFSAILLLICAILTVFLFLVRDREMSVDENMMRTPVDNYGLIMSKERMVSEFARILAESKDGPAVVEHEVRIPTYLASQDRIDLAAIVSYRWSNEHMYRSRNPNADAPRCYKIRLAGNQGFDWVVTIVEPMLQGMVTALSKGSQEYVWMDQFSIPQENKGGTMEREELKRAFKSQLIPRMIGLYSSGGIVVAFNNTGDSRILEEDWYQNRLWCLQEYTFPEKIVFEDISDRKGGDHEKEINSKRSRMSQLWFRSTKRIRSNQVADVLMDHESMQQKILLDWDQTSSSLPLDIIERVTMIGPSDYLTTVNSLSASNRNDILPALAQAWFGIIMTREETKFKLITSIVNSYFKETHNLSIDVIVNREEGSQVLPSSGSMSVHRMLAGLPATNEAGNAQLVKIKCHGVKQTQRDSLPDLHVMTGQLLTPAGFEDWTTTLECTRDPNSIEEGVYKYHLVKMTVFQGSREAAGQETYAVTMSRVSVRAISVDECQRSNVVCKKTVKQTVSVFGRVKAVAMAQPGLNGPEVE